MTLLSKASISSTICTSPSLPDLHLCCSRMFYTVSILIQSFFFPCLRPIFSAPFREIFASFMPCICFRWNTSPWPLAYSPLSQMKGEILQNGSLLFVEKALSHRSLLPLLQRIPGYQAAKLQVERYFRNTSLCFSPE